MTMFTMSEQPSYQYGATSAPPSSTTAAETLQQQQQQQQQQKSIIYVSVPKEVQEEMERDRVEQAKRQRLREQQELRQYDQQQQQQLQKRNSSFYQDITMSTASMSSSRHDPLNTTLSATPPPPPPAATAAAPGALLGVGMTARASSPIFFGHAASAGHHNAHHFDSSALSVAEESSTWNNSTMSDGAMTFLRTVQRVQRLNRQDKMRKLKLKHEAHLIARMSQSASSLLQQHDVARLSSSSNSNANQRVEFRSISDLEDTPLLAQQQQQHVGSGPAKGSIQDDPIKIQEEGHCGRDTGGGGNSSSSFNLKEQAMLLGDDVEKESIPWALYNIVFGKGIVSMALAAMPFAFIAYYQDWSASWQFWLNFIVLIPLAAILGHFTEELALHTNQTIGGLINATFGNAVEVVVGIQALLQDEIRVVQASMIGSIFSNLLLVLGCCFFFGGLYHKEQTFNSTAASSNMGLLALSGIALVLPTPFADYYELEDEHVLTVSRTAAMFLIFMYIQLLIFQLKTHVHIFEDGGDDDSAELAAIPFSIALIGLCLVTLAVSIHSNYLVQSIEGFTQDSGISRTFVGIILLPIVGNAVEHVAAVTVAIKDKMDLAMGIAVGSCAQISLFVTPSMVLIGWALGKDMTLNFPHFEVILFVMAVFTVSIGLSNPKSNWLEGSLLITIYLLIAVGFWFENVKNF